MSGGYIKRIHSDIIYDGSYGYVCSVPKHQNENFHHFLNIHKATFLVCEGCRKIKSIGTGVFGDWWDEREEIWQMRCEHIQDYDFL